MFALFVAIFQGVASAVLVYALLWLIFFTISLLARDY